MQPRPGKRAWLRSEHHGGSSSALRRYHQAFGSVRGTRPGRETVLMAADALQFSAWKARHLSFCREAPRGGDELLADPGAGWRHGLHLGLHCCCSCAGPTAILLVVGVMDLRAMAAMGAAVTGERLAPRGERVARLVGTFAVAVGLLWIARATG